MALKPLTNELNDIGNSLLHVSHRKPALPFGKGITGLASTSTRRRVFRPGMRSNTDDIFSNKKCASGKKMIGTFLSDDEKEIAEKTTDNIRTRT